MVAGKPFFLLLLEILCFNILQLPKKNISLHRCLALDQNVPRLKYD